MYSQTKGIKKQQMDKVHFDKAIKHLSRDKVLKPAIEAITLPEREHTHDVYFGLVRSIVSQQLSVKAASTIFGRFLNLFDDNYPDPTFLVALEDQQLRSVGLSNQKTKYVKNVAAFFQENNLFDKNWEDDSDQDIISLLTQIKGVGQWTLEMILMFVLERNDILPVLDLGIQNGMKLLYGIEAEKKELYAKMIEIAEPWRPYRSVACLYLWAVKDSNYIPS